MIFPRNAAFKGQDGTYLAAVWIDDKPILTFSNSHPIVEHEIYDNGDGSIRVKSKVTGKFWRTIHNGYVLADSDTGNDYQTLFWPMDVSGNVVALGSGTNNIFCKRFILPDRVTTCLRSASTTIEEDCYLEVEEIYVRDAGANGEEPEDEDDQEPEDDDEEPEDDSGLERQNSMERIIPAKRW